MPPGDASDAGADVGDAGADAGAVGDVGDVGDAQKPEESPDPRALTEFAQAIFDAQPFSRFLGARLTAIGPDSAEIRVPNRPELRQQHGFLHGGALSYLADNSLTFAGGIALGGDALTAEYKINYAKPAVGDVFIARATALVTTRRQAVCHCFIYAGQADGTERLIAVAQGTIVAANGQASDRPAH